ncbi:MAG: formimidoylglutamase [Bacteroidales bacterium]|nr:formimidoylglutamase [Bacteroidales bacterium]
MDFNDYLNPVSLEKPDERFFFRESLFCKKIKTHTPNNPITDIDDIHVAIIGIPEERNAISSGSRLAPDPIREKLYQLTSVKGALNIYDFGNLKTGNSINDTYFAIRDVVSELIEKNIVPVIIGGSQDLTYGMFLAYEFLKRKINLITFDARIDLQNATNEMKSDSYLSTILVKRDTLFNYTNIGQQIYFLDDNETAFLNKTLSYPVRLGHVRGNMPAIEPLLRDADLISLDVCSIKQNDAPGQSFPSPNGFYSEEICQLARYSGLSDRVSSFGIFEINPKNDINNQTAHLAAQIIWYFLDGLANRQKEVPADEDKNFKKFIIHLDHEGRDVTFFKSMKTNRWWIEIPSLKPNRQNIIAACNYDDYQTTCGKEIPDIYWKIFQKINY